METRRIPVEEARKLAERRLTAEERVCFDLFSLILEREDALCRSDGAHCLLAQSREDTPLWVWLAQELPEAAEDEAAACLAESLARCPALHVTLDPGRGQGVPRKAAERSGLTPETVLPMNVYACRKLQPLPLRGRTVVPREEHRPVMAALLRQMALDAEGQEVPEAAAADFAQAMVGSDRLLLWEDGDIRAMAMIAHTGGGMGRINTVVTERNSRGRGYAGMLTAALCEKLLAQGLTPMLYADAGNPSSNRAYQKIGMEARGQVTEYRWK